MTEAPRFGTDVLIFRLKCTLVKAPTEGEKKPQTPRPLSVSASPARSGPRQGDESLSEELWLLDEATLCDLKAPGIIWYSSIHHIFRPEIQTGSFSFLSSTQLTSIFLSLPSAHKKTPPRLLKIWLETQWSHLSCQIHLFALTLSTVTQTHTNIKKKKKTSSNSLCPPSLFFLSFISIYKQQRRTEALIHPVRSRLRFKYTCERNTHTHTHTQERGSKSSMIQHNTIALASAQLKPGNKTSTH